MDAKLLRQAMLADALRNVDEPSASPPDEVAQLIRRKGYEIPVPKGAGAPAGPVPIRQVPIPQVPINPELLKAMG